jgi:hypothetical protein
LATAASSSLSSSEADATCGTGVAVAIVVVAFERASTSGAAPVVVTEALLAISPYMPPKASVEIAPRARVIRFRL